MRHLILALPLALAACASTPPGEEGIAVETVSRNQVIHGASCVVSNGNGSWQVVTPGRVDTGGVNGDLRVVCEKTGYRTSEFVFRPTRYGGSGTSLGLGLGGFGRRVGGGVGFSVPLGGSGGAYPPRVSVELSPL